MKFEKLGKGASVPRLTDLRLEETAVVTQIMGGYGLRRKLALRGVKEGSRVRMISSSAGPVVIECGGSQIAIGHGMARRIMVRRR